MLFAEISDAVWLAIIGGVVMAIKEYFDRERSRQQWSKWRRWPKSFKRPTRNRRPREDCQGGRCDAGQQQHGRAAKINAVLAWRMFVITKRKEDEEAATLAERLLAEHEGQTIIGGQEIERGAT
jgi:hypothetical protein